MKVHFVSIGGSVMHQLAIALKKKGYDVDGSDDEIYEPAYSNLKRNGLLPESTGWHSERIVPDLDAVILGMHARNDNPELLKAQALGLKIYSFPEYIYAESREKTRIVVGGSHGKTTTTSMIMHVLQHVNRNFDYLVGAKLDGFDQSVSITDAPLIVCEGDEYPASVLEKRPKFHFLYPNIAVITGIAWDHINVFPTFEIYKQQFSLFIDKIEKGGILIYNEQDPILKKMVDTSTRNDISFQPYGIANHVIRDGQTFVNINGSEAPLKIFGNHNLMNLQAAYYVCRRLGISDADFLAAIADFRGASRRLEQIGLGNCSRVFRDFAHAPSKVKASIEAVKQQYPNMHLVAVLELHTYSSLNAAFMQQYHGAMALADTAVVYYSEHALQIKRMPPLPIESVNQGFAKPGLIIFNKKEALHQWLEEQDYSGKNLLLMSSGDYDGLDLIKFAEKITQ